MKITIAMIVLCVTFILGEITKLTKINNKWIPLQNLMIAIIASIICIVFKIQNMTIPETIITCIISTMSAGGIADLGKIQNNNKQNND